MDVERAWLVLGICLVIIALFGLVGNILSFLIWTKGKRCADCQGAIYLRFLALSDTLVLCVPATELAIALLEPTILLRNLNPIFCKIFPISPYLFVQVSAWLVVCLTVEQTIAVCRPFKAATTSNKRRQYGLVLFITIVSILDNLPILVKFNWRPEEATVTNTSRVKNSTHKSFPESMHGSFNVTGNLTVGNNENTQSEIRNEHKYICFGSSLSPEHVYIVQLGIIAIVPIVTLATCNMVIMTQLFRREKKLTRIASRKDGQNKTSLLATMTARTVAISVVQCITSIPIVAMDIFLLIYPSDSATRVLYDIFNTVYYVNNAINVIFYCLLGRSFRQDCVDLFTRKPKYGIRAGLSLTTLETVSSAVHTTDSS